MHRSWVGHWWFIPHHIYLLLGWFALGVLQFVFVIVDIWWPVDGRPFFYVSNLVWEYWYIFLIIALLLVPLTQRQRKLPVTAKIHKSVIERYHSDKVKYKPRNLKGRI